MLPEKPTIDMDHVMEQVGKVIEALPTEPHLIAYEFAHQGMQAMCGSPNKCAIAEHLTNTVPLPPEFEWSVGGSSVNVAVNSQYPQEYRSGFYHNEGDRNYQLPGHVETFIDNFDRRRYPDITMQED